MNVLVTGVSGFVGWHLARLLAARGHRVTGTYIRERPALPDVELLEADLLEPAALARAVAAGRPETVVHLAGLSHVGDSWRSPAEYFGVNVIGTENLMRAAPKARLVAASSAGVYGAVPAEEQPIPETRPVAPDNPYGWTKAAMERLALFQGATVVRSFNVVGRGQVPTFALPAFAAQLGAIRRGEQEPVLKVGNLAARRDFLHVADAVEAYAAIVESGTETRVFNLGSGSAVSVGEALERLLAVSGVAARVEVDPARFRPVDIPLLQADNGRLRALGWEPRHSLEEALGEIWAEAGEAG